MKSNKFVEMFFKELVKVVGVKPAFGILMKSYESLSEDSKKANQQDFLEMMAMLKKLDTRQGR